MKALNLEEIVIEHFNALRESPYRFAIYVGRRLSQPVVKLQLPRIKPLRHDANELIILTVAFDFAFNSDRTSRFQVTKSFQACLNDGARLVHQLDTHSESVEYLATAWSGGCIVAIKLVLDIFAIKRFWC